MERIHEDKGKTDGYYEADFEDGMNFMICFTSLDSEEKDLSFMVK